MTHDELAVRRRLDEVAETAPPVGFGPADLIRRGRRRRTVRRAVLAGSALAAVALVTATPAVLLRSPGPAPVTAIAPDAPVSPGPSAGAPVPATTWSAGHPGPVPGVSAADAARITRRCDHAYQGPGVLHLYNLVRDTSGLHAVLYGPEVVVSCDLRAAGDVPDGFGGDLVSTRWLPGPAALDLHGGDDIAQTVGGRVTSAVAEVEVALSGQTVRIRPVNGTYLTRIPGPGGPGTGTDLRITARDGAGRTLTVLTVRGRKPGCFTDPDGHVVINELNTPTNCRPATPWR